MKKILITTTIIFIFISLILFIWGSFFPITFSKFFTIYPIINKFKSQEELLKINEQEKSPTITSEEILNLKGQIIAKNNTWEVEISKDDISRESGLSNRSILNINHGMLFVFDKMSAHFFWMKDMLIPIDMVFFDSDWKIILIETNLQPSSFPKTFGGKLNSQYVLEINANEANSYGLKVGDKVIFINK